MRSWRTCFQGLQKKSWRFTRRREKVFLWKDWRRLRVMITRRLRSSSQKERRWEWLEQHKWTRQVQGLMLFSRFIRRWRKWMEQVKSQSKTLSWTLWIWLVPRDKRKLKRLENGWRKGLTLISRWLILAWWLRSFLLGRKVITFHTETPSWLTCSLNRLAETLRRSWLLLLAQLLVTLMKRIALFSLLSEFQASLLAQRLTSQKKKTWKPSLQRKLKLLRKS